MTMEVIGFAIIALAVAVAVLALALLRVRGHLKDQLQEGMHQLIADVRQEFVERVERITQLVVESNKGVGERLDRAAQVVGEVKRDLGRLSEATSEMREIGKNIVSLQEILRPPQLRGSLGELLLENLLAQILVNREHYDLQYELENRLRVDAVIRLGDRLVPVDAKFPLENFKRILEAPTEVEKKKARKEFIKNVKGHIDKIAMSYILPDRGTFDFALMYIPAENVYYEIILKDEEGGYEESLAAYALRKRVIPVSPHSFYAYLQAIMLGLKGLSIERRAGEVMDLLHRLSGDLSKLVGDFETLGKHLSDSRGKYEEIQGKLHRFQEKLEAIGKGGEGQGGAKAAFSS